jgi:hypothetical protein
VTVPTSFGASAIKPVHEQGLFASTVAITVLFFVYLLFSAFLDGRKGKKVCCC